MGRACTGSISAAAVALTAGWTLGVVPFLSRRLKVPIPITYGSTGCSCCTDGCVQIIVHSTVRGLSNARARPIDVFATSTAHDAARPVSSRRPPHRTVIQ